VTNPQPLDPMVPILTGWLLGMLASRGTETAKIVSVHNEAPSTGSPSFWPRGCGCA
jgi:hypothetical protein